VLQDEIPPFNKDPSICHHKESREFFPYSKCPAEMLEKCDGCRANCKCEGKELQCTFKISPLAMKHCKPNTTQGGNEDGECEFSIDCPPPPPQCRLCRPDKCNHGKCIFQTDAKFTECSKYTDCTCRSNPKECFCIDGACTNQRWECHDSKDCKEMKKCKGKRCFCRGNTCEILQDSCKTIKDCRNDCLLDENWKERCLCEKGKCIYEE